QEEYERQLEEYERQKAQYERELAEYERQKAAYDAEMVRQAAAQQQEQAGEIAPAQDASRRRRNVNRSYSDYVEGEDIVVLPDAPQWPQMPVTAPAEPAQKKTGSKLLGRMAKMIEPGEEQLAARPKLPPRVDVHDAYRTPAKPGRRNPRI
ncbi:MAG: hypothetical protein ACI4O4_10185, partial [Candidatus Ventricola sp.]